MLPRMGLKDGNVLNAAAIKSNQSQQKFHLRTEITAAHSAHSKVLNAAMWRHIRSTFERNASSVIRNCTAYVLSLFHAISGSEGKTS
jgi:hypothetical protein